MELHEAPRQGKRLRVRFRVDDRVAANDLLRLGERAVDDGDLAALELYPRALGRRLQPGPTDEVAALRRLLDELSHLLVQPGRWPYVAVILRVLDEHHVAHDRSPPRVSAVPNGRAGPGLPPLYLDDD